MQLLIPDRILFLSVKDPLKRGPLLLAVLHDKGSGSRGVPVLNSCHHHSMAGQVSSIGLRSRLSQSERDPCQGVSPPTEDPAAARRPLLLQRKNVGTCLELACSFVE